MSKIIPVRLHAEVPVPFLKDRTYLKKFLTALFNKERKGLRSLDYIFCSDAFLLNINREYLQHDYYTDIITFELSSDKNTEGEVYISIDRVKENASLYSSSLSDELRRVIFHGALHLCGYKDKTSWEKEEMRSMEQYYLDLYRKHPAY